MIYLELLWSFFQIGLLSIGGGYAALPLIKHQIVDLHGWLTMTEYTDIITISEMTPGPIAINASTFVGTRVAGVFGSIVATFGCVLPSCIIVMLLAFLYHRYKKLQMVQGVLSAMRPAAVGMIASAGLSIVLLAFFGSSALPVSFGSFNFVAFGIFVVAFFVLRKFKVNPIFVLLGAGAVGIVLYGIIGVPVP